MSASNFVLNWAKFYRNFKNVESSFWRGDSGKNTSHEWCAKFKSSTSSVEDAEHVRQPSVSKFMKMWIYHPKQNNHYLWNHKHAGDFTWVSSENYKRWMIWKVWFRGLVSLTKQHTYSLCFVSTWISGQEIKWVFLTLCTYQICNMVFICPKIKMALQGKRFKHMNKIQTKMWIHLASLKKCT